MGILESPGSRGIWDALILNHCPIDHGTCDSPQLVHSSMSISESHIDMPRDVYSQMHMSGEACIRIAESRPFPF